jgi:hypothetical protein
MDLVIFTSASVIWQRHLMRPPSIDEGRCQLSFASGHGRGLGAATRGADGGT